MPGLDGLEVIRQLRRSGSSAAILVLTMHEDIAHARSAFAAGASGYLVKRSAPWELKQAIEEVLRGRRYVTGLVAEKLMKFPSPEPTGLEAALSPREVEVSNLVALGLENAEIAKQLGIAEVTVRAHFSRILQKLQLRNRVELARHILNHGDDVVSAGR